MTYPAGPCHWWANQGLTVFACGKPKHKVTHWTRNPKYVTCPECVQAANDVAKGIRPHMTLPPTFDPDRPLACKIPVAKLNPEARIEAVAIYVSERIRELEGAIMDNRIHGSGAVGLYLGARVAELNRLLEFLDLPRRT